MKVRMVTPLDYFTFLKWWEAHKFPAPPPEILPATGYVVNECAAGYLYLMNAAVSWMEWVVTDPNAEKKLRNESLDHLINFMADQARLTGSVSLFTSSNSWPFINRLERLKFIKGDVAATQMFRRL